MTNNSIPKAVDRTPKNKNTLLDNKFRFQLLNIPHVIYFTTHISLPGFSIAPLSQPTPLMRIPRAATQPDFDQQFQITFEVDEDLNNYKEIYNWMIGISFPDDNVQYSNVLNNMQYSGVKDLGHIFSDGRLIIYTAQFNRKLEIVFEDMFPTSLSGIDFHTEDANVPSVTATFVYRRFRFDNETPTNPA